MPKKNMVEVEVKELNALLDVYRKQEKKIDELENKLENLINPPRDLIKIQILR